MRPFLLILFYCSPVGWAYLVGAFFLNLIDALTLTEEEEILKYTITRDELNTELGNIQSRNKQYEPIKYSKSKRSRSAEQDLAQPAVSVLRIFKTGNL